MLNLRKLLIISHFSNARSKSNLDILYEMSKQTKTPFFTIQSHLIEIIDDPLDFYLHLQGQAKKAINRIGISSLYLGNGSLERFLFNTMIKRAKTIPTLNISMVFDYNRSMRRQKGDSSIDMMNQYLDEEVKKRVTIAFNKQSTSIHSIIGEVAGVHHQKIALFDDTIIMGGANLSHSYFTNRRDRYIKIKECGELADYLYDYILTLSQNGFVFKEQPQPVPNPNLLNHYKLWKFSYSPAQYKQTLAQQEAELEKIRKQKQIQSNRTVEGELKKPIPKNRNIILSETLGTDVKQYDYIEEKERILKREQVRQRLFNVADQNDVGNEIMEIENVGNDQQITEVGEKVYIFPYIQFPRVGQKLEPLVLQSVLKNSTQSQLPIRISSGYMNFTKQILKLLGQSEVPTQILCSAPEANSFFRGGVFKKYIPYFYRNFQGMILERWPQKFKIKEYCDNQWSFHAKGIWIKQDDNNYLTIVGSSNYNFRSKDRDTEFQLYLYSTCPVFNSRLDKQWSSIQKNCKQVSLQDIKKDEEIKYNKFFNLLSKIFSRFL